MQDVIHHILSANPPEAGVLSGLVRPERQAGTVTAIRGRALEGLSAGAAEATPTLRGSQEDGLLAVGPSLQPWNSRAREGGWTQGGCMVVGKPLQGAGARSASLPCMMFELASLRFG